MQLVVEELAITGLDAHALQGRSISGTVNGKPLPPFSLYFDPFTSVLRVFFGDKARAHAKVRNIASLVRNI